MGTFSPKNEKRKSGDNIREEIRRHKKKHPQKIRSAKNRPQIHYPCVAGFRLRTVIFEILCKIGFNGLG